MSEREHTPGSWVTEATHDGSHQYYAILAGDDVAWAQIATVNNEVDACLMAAAPDLLDAVKELSSPEVVGTINRDRNARIAGLIAKAEGRDS